MQLIKNVGSTYFFENKGQNNCPSFSFYN
jgi:hypothetical protein